MKTKTHKSKAVIQTTLSRNDRKTHIQITTNLDNILKEKLSTSLGKLLADTFTGTTTP